MRSILPTLLALACAGAASAQSYPAKPVRLIVPWPAGGTADIIGRITAQKLAEAFGQQVVVDNRGGASGNIGTEVAVRAPADGYTLLFGSMSTHAMNQALYARMAFDPVKDVAPISLVANVASVLVAHPSLPARDVKGLIALARTRPGQLNFASGSSLYQLCGELLKVSARIDLVHVPYKGGSQAVTDLIGGQVETLFTGAPVTLPHIRAARLRVLAVTNTARAAVLPDVPTIGETLPGYSLNNWYGMMAPVGTPRAVIERVQSEIARLSAAADVREKLLVLGADASPTTPDAFAAMMRADAEKIGQVIRSVGMKAQ